MAFTARFVLVFLFGAVVFFGASLAAPQGMSGRLDTSGPARWLAQSPSPVKPAPAPRISGVSGTIAVGRRLDGRKPEFLGCLNTNGQMAAISREACGANIGIGKFGDHAGLDQDCALSVDPQLARRRDTCSWGKALPTSAASSKAD